MFESTFIYDPPFDVVWLPLKAAYGCGISFISAGCIISSFQSSVLNAFSTGSLCPVFVSEILDGFLFHSSVPCSLDSQSFEFTSSVTM